MKLGIDKNITPVVQAAHRIPFHLRKKVEEEFASLEKQGIIERVPGGLARPWVSHIVTVPKKDNQSIRIRVDMGTAITAINRVRHVMPTVEDLMIQLNGAKNFSKIDLSQAYHQIELEPECRYITTFSTHIGLFRYCRLNYGTNASSELFQFALEETLKGIQNIRNIAGGIITYGKTREEHYSALDQCFARLKSRNLTVNQQKCKYLQDGISFFGIVFSKDGMKPDNKKVEDLVYAPQPEIAAELQSVLGIPNFGSKFIKNFVDITERLRQLTKQNAIFLWKKEHETAFQKLKTVLEEQSTMGYFDIAKETYVIVHASPIGVSGILAQKYGTDTKTIAYASRTLTPVERRYLQKEKEALAIVWEIEHYHLYLYGSTFTLVTDHKPLETIYGSPKSKPSLRIERWVLRLEQYSFNVQYRPGSSNPAGHLSRHPTLVSIKENMADQYVKFMTVNAVPVAMTLAEIQCETEKDIILQDVKHAIETSNWVNRSLLPYK